MYRVSLVPRPSRARETRLVQSSKSQQGGMSQCQMIPLQVGLTWGMQCNCCRTYLSVAVRGPPGWMHQVRGALKWDETGQHGCMIRAGDSRERTTIADPQALDIIMEVMVWTQVEQRQCI